MPDETLQFSEREALLFHEATPIGKTTVGGASTRDTPPTAPAKNCFEASAHSQLTSLRALMAAPGHATASITASHRRPRQYGASGSGARANNIHIRTLRHGGQRVSPPSQQPLGW